MKLRSRDQELETHLTAMLGTAFPGIEIEAGRSDRWNRPCVMFRWEGFAGLLPEERFQRLVAAIPEEFRKSALGGFVWVELAPGETVEEVLRMPRSEDIAGREARICQELTAKGFFAELRERLARSKKKCPGDFSTVQTVLTGNGAPQDLIRDAKLVFIRRGAFCDCQVAETVGPKLETRHGPET